MIFLHFLPNKNVTTIPFVTNKFCNVLASKSNLFLFFGKLIPSTPFVKRGIEQRGRQYYFLRMFLQRGEKKRGKERGGLKVRPLLLTIFYQGVVGVVPSFDHSIFPAWSILTTMLAASPVPVVVAVKSNVASVHSTV